MKKMSSKQISLEMILTDWLTYHELTDWLTYHEEDVVEADLLEDDRTTGLVLVEVLDEMDGHLHGCMGAWVHGCMGAPHSSA